jgi:hypothetical protein
MERSIHLQCVFKLFYDFFCSFGRLEYKHNRLKAGNIIDADNAIGVTSIEGVTISVPAEGGNNGVPHLAVESLNGVLVEVSNDALALEIPDLDGGLSSSTEPVSVGAEGKGIDGSTSLEGVEVTTLVQVPETGSTVFASRGTEGTVWGDSDGVEVSSVTNQVVLDLAVAKAPHLHELVPSARNDDGGLSVGAEADAADPLSVTSLLKGVLALTENVPQLDGLVTGSRDNLAVVRGEGNGENILLVANETAGGGSSVDIPQTEHAIPRAGQGELSIGGHGDILDEVSVSSQGALGLVLSVLAVRDVPGQDGLVTGSGEDGVLSTTLLASGDGSNPAIVAS